MAPKILVVGSVNGQLKKAFAKISKLHAKQQFSFCLIVGNLFAPSSDANQDGHADQLKDDATEQPLYQEIEELLAGKISIDMPSYFSIGDYTFPTAVQQRLSSTVDNDHSLISNLYYLGRRGTFTTSDGIKLVYLGGRQTMNEESLTQAIGPYDPLYLENEARVLHGTNTAHILLTNQWPMDIQKSSKLSLPEELSQSDANTAIANLCATLKPRYHFVPSPVERWEREPFMYPAPYDSTDSAPSVVRFTALGNINYPTKDSLAAFQLDITKPPSTDGAQRAIPFSPRLGKRKRMEVDSIPVRYQNPNSIPDSNGTKYGKSYGGNPHRRFKKRGQQFDPNDCFMCIGKPTFDSSMVISISDESFMTSLRGPLPLADTFPQLKSTGNLMIIPMYHAADEIAHGSRPVSERQTEFTEMSRYRYALYYMLAEKNQAYPQQELGAVCWEVNRTGIRHFHWQWLACPASLIHQGLVKAAFEVLAEKNEHEPFKSCPPDRLLTDRTSDYFRVWIWSTSPSHSISNDDDSKRLSDHHSPIADADALAAGQDISSSSYSAVPPHTTETSMYFPIPHDQRFNIQFGRTVMAGLFNLEHRADWKSVGTGPGDEARDAEAWKDDFGKFDFAMN